MTSSNQLTQSDYHSLCSWEHVHRVHSLSNPELQDAAEGVYKATMSDGYVVRVKVMRTGQPSTTTTSNLSAWCYINKRVNEVRRINLDIIGVCPGFLGPQDLSLCVVSRWPNQGNIMDFIRQHKPDNDAKIRYMMDIAQGLFYLSDAGLVHGDIRGANILITNGTCRLGEFALERIPGPETIERYGRWIAPELANAGFLHRFLTDHYVLGRNYIDDGYLGQFKRQSDVYALGCTGIEIFTGEPPPVQRYDETMTTTGMVRRLMVALPDPSSIPTTMQKVLRDMCRAWPAGRPNAGTIFSECDSWARKSR